MTNPNPWPLDSLVDEHTGIIRRVRTVLRPDRAPTSYTSMTAEVSDARRLGEWPADRVSLGTTFGDPQGAWIAAVAEACERYCGNHLPPNGDTLRRGTAGEIWAPASLVYLNWRLRRYRDLPRTHHLNYAGIATGQGFSDACDRALFEIMERDALELWWHLGYPAHGIDPDTIPGLHEAMSGTDLEYHVVAMPHDYAPAFAALVYDPQTGLYAAGFSAKPDPAEAARKSVLEAVHTWIYTLGTQHADGWVFQAVQAGLMASGLYLPHRTDARYLDDAGPHQQHVRDLG
ncbi:hypothetical protein GZ180_00785, partial [Dermatophilus congolensis]|uniref:YcaO-like family protein n=1 Tax=Dermatophilus congolensis TaxID=1863 RepID=UPI001AB0205C